MFKWRNRSHEPYCTTLMRDFQELCSCVFPISQSERDGKERELDILLKKSPHDLWNEDLDVLLKVRTPLFEVHCTGPHEIPSTGAHVLRYTGLAIGSSARAAMNVLNAPQALDAEEEVEAAERAAAAGIKRAKGKGGKGVYRSWTSGR